jgi:hypothetical protein
MDLDDQRPRPFRRHDAPARRSGWVRARRLDLPDVRVAPPDRHNDPHQLACAEQLLSCAPIRSIRHARRGAQLLVQHPVHHAIAVGQRSHRRQQEACRPAHLCAG